MSDPNHRQDAGDTLQTDLDLPPSSPTPSSFIPQPSSFSSSWPTTFPEQVLSIRNLIPSLGRDPATLSSYYGRKNNKRETQITTILATLEALGWG